MIKRFSKWGVIALMLLSGCSLFGKEETRLKDLPNNLNVTISDIADTELHQTADSLAEVYASKPSNRPLSIYTALTFPELQKTLQIDLQKKVFVENSAKKINGEFYYILQENLNAQTEKYTVFQSQEPVYSFTTAKFTSYSPVVSVRVIEGKYTAEYLINKFDSKQNVVTEQQKIWQMGVGELTEKFALENAIMPYEVKGELLFLAQKEGKWFVMYNGGQVTELFDRIEFGYCCEPAKFQPRSFGYRYYVFFATLENKQKLVEIDLGEI